jgi:predicted glutamine amidotransferase
MCRLLGYCARRSTSVAGLLTEEGLRAFTALSAVHADGWGMAWYNSDGPEVRKSARRALAEPDYARLAARRLGDLGLVHLRWATPGLGVTERNSHPFRVGQYAFAHNGAIHPQDRLGEMLPAEWESRRSGTTDSERYFLLILSRLETHGGDVVAAIADAAADIDARFRPNSLNAILLSPSTLYAICWYHRERVPVATLRARGYDRATDITSYFDLAYRVTDSAVVIASSGWPQPDWTPVPDRHVLVADRRTLKTSVLPV